MRLFRGNRQKPSELIKVTMQPPSHVRVAPREEEENSDNRPPFDWAKEIPDLAADTPAAEENAQSYRGKTRRELGRAAVGNTPKIGELEYEPEIANLLQELPEGVDSPGKPKQPDN